MEATDGKELDTDQIKLYDHVSISRIYDEDIGFIDRPEDTPVMERVSTRSFSCIWWDGDY